MLSVELPGVRLHEQADLTSLNTFRLPGRARWLAEVTEPAALPALLADPRFAGVRRLAWGGGSNLVLSGALVDALVIRPCFAGWRVLASDANRRLVEADAGLAWHALVTACVDAGIGGIENLALIPGTVGAAPVQNIGAYGVELDSVFHGLDAIELDTGAARTFHRGECGFGYRDSVFKHADGNWLITRVRLALATDAPLQAEYRDLREELLARGNPPLTRKLVYEMVCAIRRRKLPDPAVLGNAGSFFKNPVVSAAVFAGLSARFPGLAAYPQADGRYKLAAGWLIDQAGWKGFRDGPVGVHERQALVLVNHGGATGRQLQALAARIVADVVDRYGVVLEQEPVTL